MQQGSAQVILTMYYSNNSYNSLDYGQLNKSNPYSTNSNSLQAAKYQLFSEYGISKNRSIIFQTMMTSLTFTQVNNDNPNLTQETKGNLVNYVGFGYRSSLLKRDFLQVSLQMFAQKAGQYDQKYNTLFGEPSNSQEVRVLFGLGVQNPFLNRARSDVMLGKYFFIGEIGYRNIQSYYNQLRRDLTMGFQMFDDSIILVQNFTIYDIILGKMYKSIDKASLSIVFPIGDGLRLQLGTIKEIGGFSSTDELSVNTSLWIDAF